jgi:hypothetical protein
MVKKKTERIPKTCSFLNREVALVVEYALSEGGLGSDRSGEWIPGRQTCSKAAECELDCRWAQGSSHSSNNPLV